MNIDGTLMRPLSWPWTVLLGWASKTSLLLDSRSSLVPLRQRYYNTPPHQKKISSWACHLNKSSLQYTLLYPSLLLTLIIFEHYSRLNSFYAGGLRRCQPSWISARYQGDWDILKNIAKFTLRAFLTFSVLCTHYKCVCYASARYSTPSLDRRCGCSECGCRLSSPWLLMALP